MKIYSLNNFRLLDSIVLKKRVQMLNLIKEKIKTIKVQDVLDVGTTSDKFNKSSNFLINNFSYIKKRKSISDQKISSNFFLNTLHKSISDKLTNLEINKFSSDLVISNATIEHVGSKKNQYTMISNIILLTKKTFVIATPNRYHPIEFHTLIPLIHWLPKKIHRFILKLFGLSYFAKEKNLNLLSEEDLLRLLNRFKNKIEYSIYNIKWLGVKSNLIVIGTKKLII
ncbi:MAG: hypothetical protein CK535_05585 [Pelagibacteraceae bacterium]|nr:MAG: hypothetical protein CK535_05585 [Pelagibacteraceae bacterium]